MPTDREYALAESILDGLADSEFVICPENIEALARDLAAYRGELSPPVASDARELEIELCKEMFGDHPDSAVLQRRVGKLIEYRERSIAERERKAREETVDKCIDAVHTWMLRGQSGGEIGLIAKFNAIKEAGNGR